jgi:hypothetical protein
MVDRREVMDGYILDYEWDGTTATRRILQPKGRATKLLNMELRKEDLGETMMGKWAFSMDELDRVHVARLFPGIDADNAEDKDKEWKRFARSPLSKPYRVQEKL